MYSATKSAGKLVSNVSACFERVVHGGKGHAPGFQPAIKHLGNPAHPVLQPGQRRWKPSDYMLVQVDASRHGFQGIFRELRDRTEHLRGTAPLASPDRDGGCPEPVPGYVPIRCGCDHVFKCGLHRSRVPPDALALFEQPFLDLLDVDEPRIDRVVYQGRLASVAKRVGVREIIGAVQQHPVLQIGDHFLVEILEPRADQLARAQF